MRHIRRAAALVTPPLCAAAWLQTNFKEAEQPPLPLGSTVCVVGAGTVGISTAYELARAGYKVVVLEASESVCSWRSASSGNAGTLGISSKPFRLSSPGGFAAAIILSFTKAPVKSDSTLAVGHEFHSYSTFITRGVLADPAYWLWMLVYFRALFSSGKLLDSHWKMMNKMSQEATFEVAHQEGLTTLADMRLDGHVLAVFHPDPALRSDEQSKSTAFALQHEPCLHTMPLLAHATVTAQDGQGSCSAYTHGLSQAVMTKLNVSIKCSAPVKRLLVHSGQVYGVQTQSGQEIHADGVVVCAGASSTELLFSAGVYVPIQPLRGYSVTAPALSGALRTHMIIKPYDLYITRLGDTIRFASYGELTATGTVESSEELEQRLIELVEFACPSVRKWCRWDAAQVWIGSRPLTPDCQPLVGPTCIRRLWINAGHSFHGWRDAAHSGRVLTASVLGVPPPGKEFSSLFLPSRFQPLCM